MKKTRVVKESKNSRILLTTGEYEEVADIVTRSGCGAIFQKYSEIFVDTESFLAEDSSIKEEFLELNLEENIIFSTEL